MTTAVLAATCSTAGCERTGKIVRGMCMTHWVAWYRSTHPHTLTCIVCAGTFESGKPSAKVCSRACLAARANRVEVRPPRLGPLRPPRAGICLHCKGVRPSHVGHKRYCDPACMDAARAARALAQRSPLRAALEDGDHGGVIAAIRTKCELTDGCWLWTGSKRDGYPIANVGGLSRTAGVHRMILEAKHGRPLGSQAAHHKCARPMCVNPEHLQPVTQAENTAEMLARHSYINRIAELEFVIMSELGVNHPILDRIALAAA